jgi:hypothetical protein
MSVACYLGDILPAEQRIPVDILPSDIFIIDMHEVGVSQF